jgi:predicted  nucleic acid-binding Zn-ribbon protein
MPRRAELLYALQRTDTQLAIKTRRYRQVEASLGESEALVQARDALKQAKEELSHWRTTLLDRELEAQSVSTKLQADEERLYSGRVHNPRELSDLQKETQYLERRRADLEDRQLEAMMAVDRATRQVTVTSQEYAAVESDWKAENAELSQEYEALKHELAQLLSQRKELAKRISEDDLAEYQAIRRLRRGTAVVTVKNEMCQACNVQVPQRDLEGAQKTDDLHYCSGCERILYVPEEA